MSVKNITNTSKKKISPVAATFKVPKNIKSGDYFKGYKELSVALNIPYEKGRTRKNQLDNLNRYLEIIKDDNSPAYVIGQIYNKPLPKEHKANNTLYSKYIECLLLKKLSTLEDQHLNITSKQLYSQLGMLNSKYLQYYNDRDQIIKDYKEYEIASIDINTFYSKCRDKLYEILYNSLRSLEKRFIIKHDTVYNVGIKDENGFVIYKIVYNNDKDTIQKILMAQEAVLSKMGLKSEQQIYILNRQKEFFDYVDKEVKSRYGWDGIYKSHLIVCNKPGVLKAIPDAECELNKMMLNSKVVSAINKITDKAIEDQKREMDSLLRILDNNEESNEDVDFSLVEDNEEQAKYRKIQYLLTEELLRI